MKKAHAYRVNCYTVYSNQPISIIKLQPVILKAKEKQKIGKVFQYKKQKYMVTIGFLKGTLKIIKTGGLPEHAKRKFFHDFLDVEKEWEIIHA
jgi:hypothetical protein